MENEHGPPVKKCNICEYVTKEEREYSIHMSNHVNNMYTCEVCGKKGKSQTEIDDHIQSIHVKEMFKHFVKSHERRSAHSELPSNKTRSSNSNNEDRTNNARSANSNNEGRTNNARLARYSHQERTNNGYCIHWNRQGCNHGEFCRFLHQEAPECRYQENCFRKSSCKFLHYDQSFLDQGGRRMNRF